MIHYFDSLSRAFGSQGEAVVIWAFDPEQTCWLVFDEAGRLSWRDFSSVRIDMRQFVDGKKLIERETGALPGELDLE